LLTKDNDDVPVEMRRFLTQAYDMKSVADYETGPDAFVPVEQAANAITTARRFLDCVAALIEGS
jgi:uncharacterized protein (UPF0332 family)